ncbi:unnamed protein product [Staurois parvus]|uniref:Uncharacterized protein n=1 Tax=Staurois parvus TaxID=386267 RepID=A0ABN9FFE7_9NEOB|nr:unnamed protein product [Staurois parvus]
MAVLCTAIPASVIKLTGRKIVCKQNNLPPRRRCSVNTGCRRVITRRDPVIDIHGRKRRRGAPYLEMQNDKYLHDSAHRCHPVAVYLL